MWARWRRWPSVRVAFLESVIPFPAYASVRILAGRRKRSCEACVHLGAGAEAAPATNATALNVSRARAYIGRVECMLEPSESDRTYQTRQAEFFTIGAAGLQEKAFWNSGMLTTTPLTRYFA